MGWRALRTNTTGQKSVAIGYEALTNATTGGINVGVGFRALCAMQNQQDSTALGKCANTTSTTGANTTMIGSGSNPSGATVAHEVVLTSGGGTAKGANTAFIHANNGAVYAGNNNANFSTTSDRRIKKNIIDNNIGLDKINQIQIRNFEYRTLNEITDFDNPKAAVVEIKGTQLGVIAQEVEEILPDIVKKESTGVKRVDPGNLTFYLINAVKELTSKVDEMKLEINELKKDR